MPLLPPQASTSYSSPQPSAAGGHGSTPGRADILTATPMHLRAVCHSGSEAGSTSATPGELLRQPGQHSNASLLHVAARPCVPWSFRSWRRLHRHSGARCCMALQPHCARLAETGSKQQRQRTCRRHASPPPLLTLRLLLPAWQAARPRTGAGGSSGSRRWFGSPLPT